MSTKRDKLGRIRRPSQSRGLKRPPRKPGHRKTKAFVFYLPAELAERLEAMSKDERNEWAAKHLLD